MLRAFLGWQQTANRYSASCLNSKNGSQLPLFQMNFSLPGRNSQRFTFDSTQFSKLMLTHIADQATCSNCDVRFESSIKSSHNMCIANMRAGQKINHQRISVQLHRLDGRSKKVLSIQPSIIFIKRICRSDGILISAHQQYFFVVRNL